MSRTISRTLRWDAPQATDVTQYNVHAIQDEADVPGWLGTVDAGGDNAIDIVSETEWPIVLPDEGDWSFAVVAQDGAGNTSDPLSPPAWHNVPLDLTPPDPPTNGVIV